MTAIASAQNDPTKPIRYVLPSTGGSEVIARLAAQGITRSIGQQVFVNVRTGAGGNLGAEIVAKSPPDGHTIWQITQSHAVNMSLFRNPGYDLVRDFTAITKMGVTPMIVVVHPSFPAKSMPELVKLARAARRNQPWLGGRGHIDLSCC